MGDGGSTGSSNDTTDPMGSAADYGGKSAADRAAAEQAANEAVGGINRGDAYNAGDDGFGVSQGLSQGARDAAQRDAAQAAADAYGRNGDFGMAGALSDQAASFNTAATAAGYGQKGTQTYDVSNAWGNSFFGNWAYGGPVVAARGQISKSFNNFLENPVRGIVNFAFGMIPATRPIGAIAKAANSISGYLGGPTVGHIAQGAVRGDPNLGLGQLATVDTSTIGPDGRPGPGGAFDQGGNDGGWTGVASLLDSAPAQSSTAISTAPTTTASTDQRTTYGFSGGQGVDYADLSGGFGGTNTGGRGGWRAAGAAGWG